MNTQMNRDDVIPKNRLSVCWLYVHEYDVSHARPTIRVIILASIYITSRASRIGYFLNFFVKYSASSFRHCCM